MSTVARERILVVDDEPQMLIALEDLLSDDFDVLKCESPDGAMRIAESERNIAVVLSDQRMPKMTGDALFARLDGVSPATRILVTGFTDLTAVVNAVNNGRLFAYVTKPWDPEALRLMVHKGAEYFRLAQELRTSEERLQLTFKGSAAGLFDWNAASSAIEYSPSFAALLGHDEGWAPSLAECAALIHPEDEAHARTALDTHFRERTPLNGLELRLRMKSGTHHWFMASGQAVWNDRGEPTRLAGSITDITERKQQEQRIARLTRIHAVLGGISSAIVRIADRPALLRESCRIAVDVGLFTASLVTAIGNDGSFRLLAAERPDNPFLQLVRARVVEGRNTPGSVGARLLETRRPVIINDVATADGGPFATDMLSHGYRALAAFPLVVSGRFDCAFTLFSGVPGAFDSEEVKLLGEVAANLSYALEHIEQAERLNFVAYYDGLTRLPNRDLLRDRIAQQIATYRDQRRQFAVLLFDVERFRQINESFGWPAGDRLLLDLAERMQANLAPTDTLARFSSNAFAVVLASVDEEAQVASFVENLMRECLKDPFISNGMELRISLRTGIALFPCDGDEPDVLTNRAEVALKSAKASSRKYVFYAASMNARVAERLTLETKLRRAVEREEFLLHYQPKVDVKSGFLVGLEALIRWQDPEEGLVPPGRFISVLEDTGLIQEVGTWVLRQAARQHEEWRSRELNPPRIAVNVSALQLAQPDFVKRLASVLTEYSHSAEGLDLEITESVFVDDMIGNVEKLRAAREKGLLVAIDDFGTGYSSLGYLSRLPIDALKIDRSFVIRMVENPEDTAIVTTIISLAHALGLKVIAEGVETVQQAQLLRLLRCDELQGYLMARPQSAEDVITLFGVPLLKNATERR